MRYTVFRPKFWVWKDCLSFIRKILKMFESYTRFNKSCVMQIWTLYGKILEMRSFCTISNLVKNISWDSIKRSYLKVRNICYWCRISSLLFIAPDIKFMTIVGKDGRFASLTVPSLPRPLIKFAPSRYPRNVNANRGKAEENEPAEKWNHE